MDANAFLHIYIDIDIHINIDKDISICKDRNIDFNKAYLVVLMCLGHRYQTRCPIFYYSQPYQYGQKRHCPIISKRWSGVLCCSSSKKKGKHMALRRCFGVVVRVRLTDALPLTESVVEDAHRHLNGTARPFTDGRRHKTLFT